MNCINNNVADQISSFKIQLLKKKSATLILEFFQLVKKEGFFNITENTEVIYEKWYIPYVLCDRKYDRKHEKKQETPENTDITEIRTQIVKGINDNKNEAIVTNSDTLKYRVTHERKSVSFSLSDLIHSRYFEF
jgi:hypothetical protein